MTTAIPSAEPARLIAGDTVRWLKSLPDYPASDGWSLAYTFVNATARFAVGATAQGDDHLVDASATTTASWPAGDYEWRARVTRAADAFTVASGRMTVAPAFGTTPLDTRSSARRALEAVEATIEGRASSAVAEYEIAGRRLKHIPFPELLALRDRLRVDVAREDAAERAAAGLAPRGRVMVRFGR